MKFFFVLFTGKFCQCMQIVKFSRMQVRVKIFSCYLAMKLINILSPSNGKPIIVPSQDMILGIYYLSHPSQKNEKIKGYFGNTAEIEHALESGEINVHSRVISRFQTVDDKGNIKFQIRG